jgi:PAS domain S-box-containing protein
MVFFLGGPVLGVVAGVLARQLEDQNASNALARYVADRASILRRETFVIAEALYHIRAFFQSSATVSRADFGAFTRDILARHPAIQSVEWMPRVTAEERGNHERRAREEGLEGYRIRMPNRAGPNQAAPSKTDYFPIYYMEPPERAKRAIGIDLSLDKARKSVMECSAERNELALTDPINPMQEPTSWGFLALLPLYDRPGAPARQGFDSLRGMLGIFIRARELFLLSLEVPQGGATAAISWELLDEDAGGKPVAIASAIDGDAKRRFLDQASSTSIDVGGQRWRLSARPSQEFIDQHRTARPLALGIGVFLFWELLGGIMLGLTHRSHDTALRRQSMLYESAVRSLSEGVVVANRDGRFLLFNSAAKEILGVGLKDVGMPEWSSSYGCYYPDGVTPFPPERLPLARALTGERATEEIFIRNAALSHGAWISTSGAPMLNDDGTIEGGVVTFRDISEQKRASEALRQSVKELEDLKYAVDQASIVSITNLAGEILYVNDKLCQMSGYSAGELLGQSHRILNSAYHPAAFFQDLWATISSGAVWRGVIRNRAKNGSLFWVDTTIVPLLNAAGECERYLAISKDVTASKLQEQDLLRLSSAVEQTADAVFITDSEGIISYVNPAFEAITGFTREDALGKTPRILKSGTNDPRYYEQLWRTILAGESFRSLTINRKKKGGLFEAEQTITPIKDSAGNIANFVSVMKDITDRVMRQRQEIEMRYAAQVQQQLYPAHAIEVQGYDIAGASRPAEFACGDYYDYLESRDGRLNLVLGDVSGHGLAPAMIMTATRSYLRFLMRYHSDLDEIMTTVNDVLFADLERSRFVALLLASIDVQARRLEYVNAGHTSGFVLDGAGAVKAVLATSGPALGLIPMAKYSPNGGITLDAGDIVVLMTDGVTEAQDHAGRFFEPERALDVVRANRLEPARQIVQRLYDEVRSFTQDSPQTDDITAIVCKVGPRPG